MKRLKDANKRGAARDLRKHANVFLKWTTEEEGLTTHNVLAGYREATLTRAERLELLVAPTNRKSKKRSLEEAEIGKLWRASYQFGVGGCLFRLILLTGSRRSEPAAMQWDNNVLGDRIEFPAEVAKMGRLHSVVRTPLIDQVLTEAKEFQRAGQWVFPSPQKADAPIVAFDFLGRLIETAGVAHFTPHDLRRTARSAMAKLGFDNDAQRLAVGQVAGDGLDAVYNLDPGLEVRKLAFTAFHDFVAACIAGKSTDKIVKRWQANGPSNARKVELIAEITKQLAALHAEAAE